MVLVAPRVMKHPAKDPLLSDDVSVLKRIRNVDESSSRDFGKLVKAIRAPVRSVALFDRRVPRSAAPVQCSAPVRLIDASGNTSLRPKWSKVVIGKVIVTEKTQLFQNLVKQPTWSSLLKYLEAGTNFVLLTGVILLLLVFYGLLLITIIIYGSIENCILRK